MVLAQAAPSRWEETAVITPKILAMAVAEHACIIMACRTTGHTCRPCKSPLRSVRECNKEVQTEPHFCVSMCDEEVGADGVIAFTEQDIRDLKLVIEYLGAGRILL